MMHWLRTTCLFCLVAPATLTGCGTVLDQDGALAIAPYRIEPSGRIVVEARVNDQGPYDFSLDTGASISVIFDRLRHELSLEAVPGKVVRVHGIVATDSFPLLDIERLTLGTELWAEPRMVALPGDTPAADNIDGILGVDFLRRYAVGFSTQDRVIRLYAPEVVSQKAYKGWASVPLEPEAIGDSGASLYFFDARIDGWRIPAVFDLGSGLNLMNWPAARRLGLMRMRPRKRDRVSGAIDSKSLVARHVARDVTTATINWRNEAFSVSDFEIFEKLMREDTATAILGVGLFNQRDFVIDFVRNRLLVRITMNEVDSLDESESRN